MYWGKIIGTLAGVATLKPWFALLGLFLGHQFDRGFAERYRSFQRQGAAIGRLSDDYLKALFQTMGHLAKADGRVSEAEIRAARSVMHGVGLGPAQVRWAINWFDEGTQARFPLVKEIRGLRRVGARRSETAELADEHHFIRPGTDPLGHAKRLGGNPPRHAFYRRGVDPLGPGQA